MKASRVAKDRFTPPGGFKVVSESPRILCGGFVHTEYSPCHVASLGAVLVEAHGATGADVLAQGDEVFGQVSPP